MKNKHKEQVADCAGERAVEVRAAPRNAQRLSDRRAANAFSDR
jgi:hypothetical protein